MTPALEYCGGVAGLLGDTPLLAQPASRPTDERGEGSRE